MRGWPWIWIAPLVIFCSVASTFSPSFEKCEAERGKSYTSPNKPDFFENVGSFFVCDGNWLDANSDLLTAIATLAIAGFTWQLRDTSRKQWEVAKESLYESRRAFISARGYGQYYEQDTVTNTWDWRFRPVWQNTGETPTRNFRYGIACEVRNTPLPQGFDVETAPLSGRGFMGPKVKTEGGIAPRPASIGQQGDPAVTALDVFETQQSRKFIYLYGWCRYNDTFPNTKEHVTGFCYVVHPRGDPFTFVPNDSAHTLVFGDMQHTEGNYARDV